MGEVLVGDSGEDGRRCSGAEVRGRGRNDQNSDHSDYCDGSGK